MQKTILVVEDEHILREIIKDYLLNEGYQVLEAINGKEALTLFEENEVHLVILDIMMPELDGWSVCRRIRKTSNIPVIMLTARADEDDTLLGFELGADDYVTKPFSPHLIGTGKTVTGKPICHRRRDKWQFTFQLRYSRRLSLTYCQSRRERY